RGRCRRRGRRTSSRRRGDPAAARHPGVAPNPDTARKTNCNGPRRDDLPCIPPRAVAGSRYDSTSIPDGLWRSPAPAWLRLAAALVETGAFPVGYRPVPPATASPAPRRTPVAENVVRFLCPPG